MLDGSNVREELCAILYVCFHIFLVFLSLTFELSLLHIYLSSFCIQLLKSSYFKHTS